jgi:hypothetical protein
MATGDLSFDTPDGVRRSPADMALGNFIEMRARVNSRLFQAQVAARYFLEQRLPGDLARPDRCCRAPIASAETMSVPPETDISGTAAPISRSADRSWSRAG